MKMRELEQKTGVKREMIHYYIRNGMLPEPERPKPRTAIYSEQHVAAIRSIRQLQTEGRLKIEEIKQLLQGNKGRISTRAASFRHLDELFAAHAALDTDLVPLSEIKARNPKAENDARIFESMGAIELITRGGRVLLSHVDAEIVAAWGDMRAAGATEDVGLDPTLLALHVELAERLATGEVKFFLERVSPALSNERKAEIAHEGSKVILELFTLLRMKAAVRAFATLTEE